MCRGVASINIVTTSARMNRSDGDFNPLKNEQIRIDRTVGSTHIITHF